MKKFLFLTKLFVTIFSVQLLINAGGIFASDQGPEDIRSQAEKKAEEIRKNADAFFKEGGIEDLEKVIKLYEKLLAKDPDSFPDNWKMARGCWFYADLAKRHKISGWKDICKEYGKKGMKYAKEAIELEPDKPHGYYYYGLCAGSYSDGVGLFTALGEGLKDKVLKNLEKAYEIDKYFAKGGPIIALGRFWQVVPWPYNDKDKALQYYREYRQQTGFSDSSAAARVYVWMAEILMDRWDSESEKEACRLLEKAVNLAEDPYWKNQARELLEEF